MSRFSPVCRLVLTLLAVLIPLPARAIPAITCHCFTDRVFDPARPAAADPYFLATVQNSFMAAAFGIDKKSIVLKKQRGIPGDDLWVACRIASRSKLSVETLLEERQKGSWREVIASSGVPASSLGPRFVATLAASGSPAPLAVAIVNDLVIGYRLRSEAELTALRAAGATNQEVIMAVLLADRTGRPAEVLCREVKSGNRSWGGLLKEAKIEPAGLQGYLASRLKGG